MRNVVKNRSSIKLTFKEAVLIILVVNVSRNLWDKLELLRLKVIEESWTDETKDTGPRLLENEKTSEQRTRQTGKKRAGGQE